MQMLDLQKYKPIMSSESVAILHFTACKPEGFQHKLKYCIKYKWF